MRQTDTLPEPTTAGGPTRTRTDFPPPYERFRSIGNIAPVFTTGEAAAVCRVSQQSIIRLLDGKMARQTKGRSDGVFRVPGSSFRRVTGTALEQIVEDQGLPVEVPAESAVIVVSRGTLRDRLKAMMDGCLDRASIYLTDGEVGAGMAFADSGADTIIVDAASVDAETVARLRAAAKAHNINFTADRELTKLMMKLHSRFLLVSDVFEDGDEIPEALLRPERNGEAEA